MKKRKSAWVHTQRQVHGAWAYLKESKRYVGGATLFFLACIVIGVVFADSFTFFNRLIAEMQESVSELSGSNLMTAIFLSNTRSACFALFLGVLLGIFSVVNIALNGALIGYVMHALWAQGSAAQLWKLLPHGIFELPALFISWGLGIKLGMFIFTRDPAKEFKRRVFESLKVFFFIVIPLLFVAAIIEGLLITFFA